MKNTLALIFLCGPCCYDPQAFATTGDLLYTFNDPPMGGGDFFGFSVAVDGNHVLIGAVQDGTNGDFAGQAHLYDATTGNLLHTFNDPTVTRRDRFGWSVAVDGNHVLIGEVGDDTNGTDVGQAHLYDATTGNLVHTFNDPTVASNNLFGVSVAVDGNHVLIGATRDDTNGIDAGQAHLYDATTGNLVHTFNDPTVRGSGRFGRVAVDGNHVLVGAPFSSTNGFQNGQAHLYDATTGNLLHTFNDPTVTRRDWFGASVAVDGNHVLIGEYRHKTNGHTEAGQAHLFLVPEPGTGCLLAGLGLIAAGFRGRIMAQ